MCVRVCMRACVCVCMCVCVCVCYSPGMYHGPTDHLFYEKGGPYFNQGCQSQLCLLPWHRLKYGCWACSNSPQWSFMCTSHTDMTAYTPPFLQVGSTLGTSCIGGSGGVPLVHAPQQDPFLSFLHTFLPKSVHIGGWHPPKWVGAPQWEILVPPL